MFANKMLNEPRYQNTFFKKKCDKDIETNNNLFHTYLIRTFSAYVRDK